MGSIITFTANLLAETTYEFELWKEGKTSRAIGESFQVGGKGINVSKMLNRLGAPNVALCFPGGVFGSACEAWMRTQGIEAAAFSQGCVTRSGTVVRSPASRETTFLGVDSVVSAEAVAAAVEWLGALEEPIVFAVCGSVQSWSDARWEPLRQWVSERPESARLVVDNYGPSMRWFAAQRPDILKCNRDELELLFDDAERGEPTKVLLEKAAERYACPRWVVTDGGNPVWYKEGAAAPASHQPPQVDCVSATGCGDVFFATLLDCLYNRSEYGLPKAVELAADYASRSAAMPGIAEFEL